jgi:redox-sensitive bicupin YhaK (pirin superfamily)
MVPASEATPLRIVTGEIRGGNVTTRLVLPTAGQPIWPPFRRISEGIASRGRHLPTHTHEREEVLTYVLEGFTAYEGPGGPAATLPEGSAWLLTAVERSAHRVSPAEGASSRWFNLVVGLPKGYRGPDGLQSLGADRPAIEVDNVRVRRLVGPKGPIVPGSGLEFEAMAFAEASTTFRKVGPDRRAFLYAWSGRGSLDREPVEAGETAFIDGVPGVSIYGNSGFRALFASAPREAPSAASGAQAPAP